MCEAGYNVAGFRVCVCWLPIIRRATSFINPPLVHSVAVFTCLAIGPVNTNPTYNLIPKNEIIWHIQPPAGAYQQCREDQRAKSALADVIGNAVHVMRIATGRSRTISRRPNQRVRTRPPWRSGAGREGAG